MTEQIERELAELFHDRAARLDVLPPLPARQVRRARLQVAMAFTSVVALVAGVGVVGTRALTGSDANDRAITVTATGQDAMDDLQAALRRTLSAPGVATAPDVRTVQHGKFLEAPDLGYGVGSRNGGGVTETKYDGRVGDAVTSTAGRTDEILVHDVLYTRLEPGSLGHTFPPQVAWVRHAADDVESLRQHYLAVAFAIPALFALSGVPGPGDVVEHDGRIRLETPEYDHLRFIIVAQLGRSGQLTSVTTRFVYSGAHALSDMVQRVTFRPLADGIRPDPPAAGTVISDAQYRAARDAYRKAHETCTTTPPSTGPDGTYYGTTTRCTDGSGSGSVSSSVPSLTTHVVPAVTPTPSPS